MAPHRGGLLAGTFLFGEKSGIIGKNLNIWLCYHIENTIIYVDQGNQRPNEPYRNPRNL